MRNSGNVTSYNTASNSHSHPNEEKDFDLNKLFSRIISNWWVFAISLLVCGTAGFLAMRYSTPKFRVNAKLLINDQAQSKTLGTDLPDLSTLMGVKSDVDNEAEVLKTRIMMEKVVKKLQLNVSLYRKGIIRDVEVYQRDAPILIVQSTLNDSLAPTRVLISNISRSGFSISYVEPKSLQEVVRKINYNSKIFINHIGNIEFEFNKSFTDELASEYYLDLRSIDEQVANYMAATTIGVTSTNISTIDLSFIHPLPKKGEDVLTVLIDEYVKQTIVEKNKIADSTISFIENRLILVARELSNVEGSIQNFKQFNKLADLSEQSRGLIDRSGDLIKKLADIETKISVVNSLEEDLRKESKQSIISTSVFPEDPLLADLGESYNSTLLELEKLKLTSTKENPFVKNLQQKLEDLRSAILKNLLSNKKSLLIARTDLKKSTGGIENEIKQVPAQERTYLDLTRQQQIKQTLYVYLLQKREETAISKTSNISNSLTIDPPKSEFEPISPKKALIYGLSFILAIIFPIVRIILVDILNKRIYSKDDITNHTEVPVVGEISHNNSKDPLIIMKDSRSSIAEQFRALRTNIHFYLSKDDAKVILFTSSMPGEGKSFLSVNFANVMAISGKKVVIMEMDLRKPKVSSQFGIDNKNGFSNYIITKNTQPKDIIVSCGTNSNLYLIPSGPIPPNPAELILHEKTDLLFQELRKEFDYIIIDSPPLGLVTDAQLLSRYTDMTLYVVRHKYTLKAQLSIPQNILNSKKMKRIGIVVNDIEVKGRASYNGYGGEYGYGYGYGYGYYSDDKEKITFKNRVKKIFS